MPPAQEDVLLSSVTYEELADLERDFDDVETEIIRQQVQLTRPLYEKRAKTVAQIPNFWPLVLEQAPPDIDEFIQPSDSALLLSSLTALSVSHFELDAPGGDPRSVAFRFDFAPNDHFEDAVLEKRFWYRHAEDGSAGLVSEPVEIRWKKGKDLTQGLLGLVKKVWDEEQAALAKNGAKTGKAKKEKKPALTAEQKALKKKIESTGLGGLSFFAWFGYRGGSVTAEESKAAVEKEQKQRQLRREGKPVEEEEEEDGEEDEDDEDEEDEDDSLEIFPEGEQLAVCIAEDLWPGAIKYFTQAQEQDAMSDEDFESDADEDGEAPELVEVDEDEPPAKKRKA